MNGVEAEKHYSKAKDSHDLDCKLGRKKFKCEVKYDVMAEKTGNVAIEYHNSKRDEPSGINVTLADIWVHIITDSNNRTMWITSVKNLLVFIQNNTPYKTIIGAGDKNACLYLYKAKDILQPSKGGLVKVDGMGEIQFKKILKELLKG